MPASPIDCQTVGLADYESPQTVAVRVHGPTGHLAPCNMEKGSSSGMKLDPLFVFLLGF